MKKTFIMLVLPLLLLAGCTANTEENNEEQNNDENVVVQEEQNQEQEQNNEESEGEENGEAEQEMDEEEVPAEISTTLYENKAVAYTISRPENWYWRHYTKPEIKAAGGNEDIDDYFIMGKEKLPELGDEYVGPIVIEKSGQSLDELKNQMQGYSSHEAEVAGKQAMKFEGKKGDNDVVAYVLEMDNMTLRFIYEAKSELHKKAFDIMVESFDFVK